MDYDIRLLLAVTFRHREQDYVLARAVLRDKSRSLVKDATDRELYLHVATFPRWEGPDGMKEFEPLFGVYNVSDDMCVCYGVRESPISDYIAGDIAYLDGTKLWEAVVGHIQFVLRDSDFESAFLWIGECQTLPQYFTTSPDQVIDHLRRLFDRDAPSDLALLITRD